MRQHSRQSEIYTEMADPSGISLTISSTNELNPGFVNISLTKFLQLFETPKERRLVLDGVHKALRMQGGKRNEKEVVSTHPD